MYFRGKFRNVKHNSFIMRRFEPLTLTLPPQNVSHSELI
jgi:hypothetical protein